MNELIEQIKRDAVTIQKFTEAELQTRQILKVALGPAYKEVETTHDAIDRIMTRNAQTEARMFNDTAKRLDAASTRIHELEGKLQTAETRIAELLCEPDQAVRTLRDLESTADDNGRKPDEAVREFLTRTVSELMTAEGKVRRIQKHAIICNAKPDESVIDFMSRMKDTDAQLKQQLAEADSAADKNGCHATEETAEFINRLAAELKTAKSAIREKDSEIGKLISLSNERALEMTKLKESHSATSDGLSSLQIENLKRQLQTAKDDLERQHLRETKISAEYQADIKKILTTANKLGRADYESPEAFMNRQAADMESQARQLNLVRQELGDKTQKVLELSRWHEENLEKIKSLETDLAHSRSQESPEATRNALRNVTADRDRIRTELAAILAEANKSGRCNGDPVQLLKQGQADLDALIRLETDKANLLGRMDNLETQLKAANAAALSAEEHAERATFSENESAKLNALVSKLQGELATARDQAGVAQHECSIWNNAATRAGQTLTKLGKLQDENEAQFIERMQGAEFNREEQLKNALAAKNKAQSEDDESHRRFMNLIRMADSCGRLRGESVEQFVARQDQLRVSNMEQRDEARSEVERLSALVAELQVELDDARGQYGGIMAQLGNETPLQLIERMQRLAQDQRASTIPHDERAMLVSEIADLRKRLEKSQRAHAEVEHELRDARNGANECGMNSGEKLRAFIYRKRGELLDALHANDKIHLLANERGDKLRAAMETVANQSAAIAEAQRVVDKYTGAAAAATKLKDWAFTVRHKVLVKIVHDKAMEEYDTIIKELDGEAVANGS